MSTTPLASSVQTAADIQTGVNAVQAQENVLQSIAADLWKVIATVQALPVASTDTPKKQAILVSLMKFPSMINNSCGNINSALQAVQLATTDVYDWDARREAFTTGLAGMLAKQMALLDQKKVLDAEAATFPDRFAALAAAAFPH